MSKKYFILFAIFFISRALVSAQDVSSVPEGSREYYYFKNSIGNNVFTTDSLDIAMEKYLVKNKRRTVNGYRLRIFFDNSQNARIVSERVLLNFSERYPNIPIFRVYDNPYWRVTVGRFRTKSEAMKFRNEISQRYPTVFLVRESFSTI